MKFDDLCPKHRPFLVAYARKYTNQSEDLVQDTLLRAFTYWDQFAPATDDIDRDVKVWLKRILTNTYYTQYARSQRAMEGLEAYRSELELDEGVMDFDHVRAAVDSLDPIYKDLIERHYYEDKTMKEIAQ